MIITLVIIVLGLVLALYKPYLYVCLFGLLGSDMDALGFVGYFKQYFPYYDLVMLFLLLVALVTSVIRYLKRKQDLNIYRYIGMFFATMLLMILAVVIYFSFLNSEGNIVIRILKAITIYAPTISIIWMTNKQTVYNGDKILFKYLCLQCVLAVVIIYLSKFNIDFFNKFNAGYYNGCYYYTNEYNDMIALPSNFYLVFTGGKNNYFLRSAQFHNSNALGFAAGTLLFLAMHNILIWGKKENKIKYILIFMMAFLLWCNSGTRGVIGGILLGGIIYLLKKLVYNKGKMKIASVILATIGLCFLIILLLVIIIDSSGNIEVLYKSILRSFETRSELMNALLDNYTQFFCVGNGGNLDIAVDSGIDPHFLTFRIYVMYGISAALLIFWLTFVKPIKILLSPKNKIFYSIVLAAIIVMVGSTNNLTAFVLFWIIFAEIFLGIKRSGSISRGK